MVNVGVAPLLLKLAFATPATTTTLPTWNECATDVVTVTTLDERTAAEIAIASLRGVVVSSDDVEVSVLANVVQVSSPSVSRIVMYGRHCDVQQQLVPAHQLWQPSF